MQKHNEIISQQYNTQPIPDKYTIDNITTLQTPQVPSINEILQTTASQPFHLQNSQIIPPNIPNSQDDFYQAIMEISKNITLAQQQTHHTQSAFHITTQPTINTNQYHQHKKHKTHYNTTQNS